MKNDRKQPLSLATKIFLGLGLGIVVGVFFGEQVAFLNVAGEAFIQLLQMAVLPIVAISLVDGIGRLSYDEALSLAKKCGIFHGPVAGARAKGDTTVVGYSDQRDVQVIYGFAIGRPQQGGYAAVAGQIVFAVIGFLVHEDTPILKNQVAGQCRQRCSWASRSIRNQLTSGVIMAVGYSSTGLTAFALSGFTLAADTRASTTAGRRSWRDWSPVTCLR